MIFTKGLRFFVLLFCSLIGSMLISLETDIVIFLFDHGEKNMIASMLRYAEENDKVKLESLDFKIVFMGASVEAMQQEPFSHFPDKLIHYKDLGIEESIDHQWKRDRELSQNSMDALSDHLKIRKKAWVGVSCAIYKQLALHYQNSSAIEVTALRDNPGPDGDTDYFKIAKEVQKAAEHLAIPSQAAVDAIEKAHKNITVVGHAPLEEWQQQAERVNKQAVVNKLDLNSKKPILVYVGAYGDFYADCFNKFLAIAPKTSVQILILPHPRYKGSVELNICETMPYTFEKIEIVGEFLEDPSKRIKSLEAISIADLVVVSDATSTTVFQAHAIGKPVFYVHTGSSG